MRKSRQIFLTHLSGIAVICVLSSSHFAYAEGPSKSQHVKTPDDRVAMAFSGADNSKKEFVIGDDGVAARASEAAPAAIVDARAHKVQRPDIINAYAAIDPSSVAPVQKDVGIHAVQDPRMAEVEKFSATQLEQMVIEFAKKEGVDPKFAVAIAKIESRFNQFAVSEDGAIGVMQLMPATATDLGVENPWDAAQNIQGGVRYLKDLTAQFQHPLLVAAAYHSGPQAVHNARGIPKGPRTAGYVAALLNDFYNIYDSSGAAANAPVSNKKRPSHVQTAALSGANEQSSEETPAANGVGKWEQGFVLHLD